MKLLLALGSRDNYLRKINNNKNVPVKNGPFLTGCEFTFLSPFTFIVSCIFAFPLGKELLKIVSISFEDIIFSHLLVPIFQGIECLLFFIPSSQNLIQLTSLVQPLLHKAGSVMR